jgi:hypothetical protein
MKIHKTTQEAGDDCECVAGMENVASGAVNVQHEFRPFGQLLRATGGSAKANPSWFPTIYAK